MAVSGRDGGINTPPSDDSGYRGVKGAGSGLIGGAM
jgi:hypothetical protein